MSDESLWVLLGNRHGDNRQLLAIADALQRPYRAVQLHFRRGARLAPARWFAHRLTWRTEPELSPPWPRAILAAGRKSVPAALWIRRASGGQTRLIHVNRPWAPLARFDLVVTTPQYALPGANKKGSAGPYAIIWRLNLPITLAATWVINPLTLVPRILKSP